MTNRNKPFQSTSPPATQVALQLLSENETVTITEALRRLVGYGALVYDTVRDGHMVLLPCQADRGR